MFPPLGNQISAAILHSGINIKSLLSQMYVVRAVTLCFHPTSLLFIIPSFLSSLNKISEKIVYPTKISELSRKYDTFNHHSKWRER